MTISLQDALKRNNNRRVTPVAFALHSAANLCTDMAEIATRRGGNCSGAKAKALREASEAIRQMIAKDQR